MTETKPRMFIVKVVETQTVEYAVRYEGELTEESDVLALGTVVDTISESEPEVSEIINIREI